MLSRAITPKRRGRRPLAAIAVLTVITGLMVAAGTALAVHDLEFQLDGDTSEVAQNNPNDPDPAPAKDWDTLFDADGDPIGIDTDAATGFNDGSSTRLPVEGDRNQDCKADAALPAPGHLLHQRHVDVRDGFQGHARHPGVAVQPGQQRQQQDRHHERVRRSSVRPSGRRPDHVFRSGQEQGQRQQQRRSGSSRATRAARPAAPSPSRGEHADGDVLVVSAFTNGGGVSNIDAYRWDGDDDCIDSPNDPATVTAADRQRWRLQGHTADGDDHLRDDELGPDGGTTHRRPSG